MHKESQRSEKGEISGRDLRKHFREFKNRKFLLVSKCLVAA